MVEVRKGSLADPDFEPTDEELMEIGRGAGRLARWQSAMADQGIKVLALGLSNEEMCRRADAWAREQEGDTKAPG